MEEGEAEEAVEVAEEEVEVPVQEQCDDGDEKDFHCDGDGNCGGGGAHGDDYDYGVYHDDGDELFVAEVAVEEAAVVVVEEVEEVAAQ